MIREKNDKGGLKNKDLFAIIKKPEKTWSL